MRFGAGTAIVILCVAATTACSHGAKSAKPDDAPTTSTSAPTSATPTDATPARPAGVAPVPDHISAPGVTVPTGTPVKVPASINANCSQDVTAQLESFLQGVRDGSTVAFPTNGCFRVEGTVVLARRANVLIEGNGATIKATTPGTGDRLAVRGRSQLSITGSTNVTVRDLVVRGANPHAGTADAAYQARYEAQQAFNLNSDNGVLLDNVQAYDTYGDFVYVGGTPGKPSHNVTVARSRFARSGRQGISITNADGVYIVGNQVDDVRRSFIDLEPNIASAEVRDVHIVNNTTGAIVNYWLANKGVGTNIGDITAQGNVMRARSGGLVIAFGPKRGVRGPYTFTGNVFQATGTITDEDARGAFLFSHTANVTVTGNAVDVVPSAQLAGVELRSVDGATIASNRFVGTTRPVIADSASRGVRTS